MYTYTNFKTKKALKEAVANGDKITYYQPGPFGGNEPKNGTISQFLMMKPMLLELASMWLTYTTFKLQIGNKIGSRFLCSPFLFVFSHFLTNAVIPFLYLFMGFMPHTLRHSFFRYLFLLA